MTAMTPTLTDEQRLSLEREGALKLLDPHTKAVYVLVRQELYERVRALIAEAEDRDLQEAWLKASQASAAAWMKENPY
jgi:hypothetical protein